MIFDHREEHGTQWAAIQSIAAKIGCSSETLRGWVRQAERDHNGVRGGVTSSQKEELAKLRREVRELRQANCGPAQLMNGNGQALPAGSPPRMLAR